MSRAEPSPRPWTVVRDLKRIGAPDGTGSVRLIANFNGFRDGEGNEANCEHAVKCVNAMDEIHHALDTLGRLNLTPAEERIRAILAQVFAP